MDAVISSDSFQKCSSLYVYLDVRNEVCTKSLIEYCFTIGKPVHVPFIENSCMYFSELSDLSQVKEAAFSIPAPIHPIRSEPDSESLFIVPGVGFDESGNRLGYGAGYYDKYLAGREYMHLIGVCFEIQIADAIPSENTDVLMDCILTEIRQIFPKK